MTIFLIGLVCLIISSISITYSYEDDSDFKCVTEIVAFSIGMLLVLKGLADFIIWLIKLLIR